MKNIAIWLAPVLIVAALTLVGGCSLDEVIRVDVPRDVQKDMGVGSKISLRDARELRETLLERQQASIRAFDREIADGAFAEEFAGAAVNDLMPIALPAVGNLPGGAVLVGLVTGIAGLITRRPGDAKKIKEAEDSGYDMGRTEGIQTINAAK